VADLVRFTGVLPIAESTVVRLAQLLDTERRRRRTRRDRRALGTWRQAVLVLRWFLDATRGAQLAVEDQISVSTAYRYLHEGIDVLAAVAPGLRGRARSAWCAARREVDVIEHSALELRARKERAA
jgi:hypothetical protein